MKELSGGILLDAESRFLGMVLQGQPYTKLTSLVPLPQLTTPIHLFHLKAPKERRIFIDKVGLLFRFRAPEGLVLHKELPIFFPSHLAKEDWRCLCVNEGDTVELEFNQTEEAVRWRKEFPAEWDFDQFFLITGYCEPVISK